MSKLMLLLFFVLVYSTLSLTAARALIQPYQVTGKAYCDTCRCGFETNVTTYISNAKVELQCKDKLERVIFKTTTSTDHTGTFKFVVNQDHGDDNCDVVLVSSPLKGCNTTDPGRSRSRVIVTDQNGIASFHRYANALGFLQDHTLPVCAQLLRYYLYSE